MAAPRAAVAKSVSRIAAPISTPVLNAATIAPTSRSWKTIFSVWLIGPPRIGAFAAGADWRADCNKEDNIFSGFRKAFAQAWRESLGFLRFFRAGSHAGRAPGGAATALARIARPRSVSTVVLSPQLNQIAAFSRQMC
jgi:hypothetical protein